MKVSDIIIKFLEDKGINTTFTISGGGCIHLIESLRNSNMNVVCPHHEQACLMASEGYFRATNKMAANVVTTGPGGTNTITGLLGLWLDSIPSIIISGQVPSNQLSAGTGCRQIGDQEFDIISVVKPMTKYATIIKNKNSILYELNKAYQRAISGRPGPVWIDVPLDIQGATVNESDLEIYPNSVPKFLPVQSNEIDKLKSLLKESKKPLVVVGNGVRLSDTYLEVSKLLERTGIPVVTGPHSGVDAVDNTLPYYCGRIGILGQLTANQIVQECDLIIGLGTRLPVKMTGYNVPAFAPNSKKVFVDVDSSEVEKHSFKVDLAIINDLNNFLDAVKDIDFDLDISEWQKFITETRAKQVYVYPKHKEIKDYASFYYLISKAPSIFKDTPIVTSNGTAHVVTLQTYQLNQHQRLFTNVGCASMGYGLPAAIGACVGTNKPVICVEGDGSIMMNLQELQTVVGYKLPIKIILVNNDGYLSIKLSQEAFFNGNEFASSPTTGVTTPSYKKIADAFDIPYMSINSNDQVEDTLNDMMTLEGPCIVEVFTHPKERHEPKVTHKGVGADGKIIPGTLTDMFISDTF